MTVLNEAQRRLLTFVQAANHGGYSPTPEEVVEWVERPDLKPGTVTKLRVGLPSAHDTIAMVAEMRSQMFRYAMPGQQLIEEREPDETLVEQVLRFHWAKPSATGAGLVLTGLGRALLRADTDQAIAAEITMLGGDDPLAWGSLVGTIAEVGECLIVDPYLKPEQFLDIANFTGTTRVILKRPREQYQTVAWQIYQASPGIKVKIRTAEAQLLHDRYIVGETAVYILGCSLNGVGVKPTTLVPLVGEIADQVRGIAERCWEASEPIGDPPAAEVESEGDPDSQSSGSVDNGGETP